MSIIRQNRIVKHKCNVLKCSLKRIRAWPRFRTLGVTEYKVMPKKEKKRLQVVISDDQDALLTKLAYELSSPEQLVSKSEVVRLAIEKLADGMEEGQQKAQLKEMLKKLEVEEE